MCGGRWIRSVMVTTTRCASGVTAWRPGRPGHRLSTEAGQRQIASSHWPRCTAGSLEMPIDFPDDAVEVVEEQSLGLR